MTVTPGDQPGPAAKTPAVLADQPGEAGVGTDGCARHPDCRPRTQAGGVRSASRHCRVHRRQVAAESAASDPFWDQVVAFIDQFSLIPVQGRIIVGVSGGPDSMALLAVLERLRQQRSGFELWAAHLHHGLRQTADRDEALVAACCAQWSIPFYSCRQDIARLAAARRQGLEDTGRQARQAYFAELAARPAPVTDYGDSGMEAGEVRIALAHHQDDQAESLLLHLGRGCGLDGLAGMQPRQGAYIRPLLGVRRQAILDWLAARQIPWAEDETNGQPIALRNRLRLQVLPAWRSALGFDPVPSLCRLADNVREDLDYLETITAQAWRRILVQPGAALPALPALPIRLRRSALAAEHPAMQMRLLRQAWRQAAGSGQDLEKRHLLLLQALLTSQAPPRAAVDLPGRLRAWRSGDLILFGHQAESVTRDRAGTGRVNDPGSGKVTASTRD